MGLAVGLSGLTAWAMYRFNTARQSIHLPPMGDPGYEAALRQAQEQLTSSALQETFIFSAILLGLAFATALLFRRRAAAPAAGPTVP
jgi:hypothetical protein